MIRNLVLLGCALAVLGCSGGGTETVELHQLDGQLTDGDIRILDNQLADPFDFVGQQTGEAVVTLHTEGLHGMLIAYNAAGEELARSTAGGEFDGTLRFQVLATEFYKIMVAGTTTLDQGSYSITYSPELMLFSQIRGSAKSQVSSR